MAGKKSLSTIKRSLNDNKNMKGRHAKNKSSAQKRSKNYQKPYRGQGR